MKIFNIFKKKPKLQSIIHCCEKCGTNVNVNYTPLYYKYPAFLCFDCRREFEQYLFQFKDHYAYMATLYAENYYSSTGDLSSVTEARLLREEIARNMYPEIMNWFKDKKY